MRRTTYVSPNQPSKLLLAFGLLALAACGEAKTNADPDTRMASAAGPATSPMRDTGAAMGGMAGMEHAQMGAMTGNPDQDFLRMMSDHHKGLIELAHMTKDGKGSTAVVRADASKLDALQDAGLDTMTTMLETSFKDPYQPKIMPQHQAMVDSLRVRTGIAYDRAFFQDVVAHHQEGIKMIDEYLPKLTRPEIKGMAQRMRDMQAREIVDFQKKLSGLK